jgi:DNA-binding Lrp family transcriptional regulator
MDEIDQQVVSCLLQDARATYNEIGKVVGLSAPR